MPRPAPLKNYAIWTTEIVTRAYAIAARDADHARELFEAGEVTDCTDIDCSIEGYFVKCEEPGPCPPTD
jgi:hypothetical protein